MPLPSYDFDPLIDFAGQWNVRLAERYLPRPDMPKAKYECVDGRLYVTPTEGFANSFGELELAHILRDAANDAGFVVAGRINLAFEPGTWLEPDLAVLLRRPDPDHDTWVPVKLCQMAVEFVSRSNRKNDLVDKPMVYARIGVPYLMRVELVRQLGHAHVELFKLRDKAYLSIGTALAGQRLTTQEPFAIDFDPRDLLP